MTIKAGEETTIEQHAETNEDLFDAISHGIENEGELPPEEPVVEGEVEPGEEGAGEGTDEVPADETSDEEADAAGYARDPVTGKFVKKEAESGGTKFEAKPTVEAKKADPINDPIPKDMKAETQTRMRSLIDMAKTATATAEKAQSEFNQLVSGIQATNTTPEQFGEVMSFMALFNSGDPAQQVKGLELIEDFADRLATLLGKERTIKDPLEAHADLVNAVKTGALTAQYAKEIARTRNGQGLRTTIQTQQQTQQQQQEQFTQAQNQGRADLNTLGGQLEQRDGKAVFDAKRAALVPVLQPMFKTMHPSQWQNAFAQAYANYKYVPAATNVPGNTVKVAPKQHPMRAGKGSASGGAVKQSGSALDAVNAALAGMGG